MSRLRRFRSSRTQGPSDSADAAESTPSFERTPGSIGVGVALVLVGGVLWGTNASVSKILMTTYHAAPLWLACMRETLAGVLFLICAGFNDVHKLAGAVRSWRSWPRFIFCAVVCVLMTQVAYLSSIKWTNSGTATILQSLNLLFVLAWVCFRGRRWPSRREAAGVALAFVGTVLIATGGNPATLKLPLMGLFWGLINALATSAMSVVPTKLIVRWGNLTVNGLMFLISGLILLPFVRPWAAMPTFDWFGWLLMAYTILGGTFGAYWLFLAGLMRVGPVRATMLGTSEPVAATITGIAWTGEEFAVSDVAGFAMILAMVFLVH